VKPARGVAGTGHCNEHTAKLTVLKDEGAEGLGREKGQASLGKQPEAKVTCQIQRTEKFDKLSKNHNKAKKKESAKKGEGQPFRKR